MAFNGTNYDKGSETRHQSYNQGGYNKDGESSIGPQIRTDYYAKKALIDLKKEQFFSQMADTMSMPKHMGKTIKKYHYLPLLDDRNGNDQGIDASGVMQDATQSFDVFGISSTGSVHNIAKMPYDPDGDLILAGGGETASATMYFNRQHPDGVWSSGAQELLLANKTEQVQVGQGNLYGSSKDIGTIVGKMPALSEHGGRVNRVGFKRIELEGTLEKFGYFDEYTQESLDFDTDSQLMMHVNREMLRGANEITEDALQIDLLNNAGVVRYAGGAMAISEISADHLVTYDDLQKLSKDLDDNRTPKNTKIITGSRMIDTRVIDSARYLYVGSDVLIMLKNMEDNFGAPAFIPTQQYGAATTLATGEVGSIDQFRIILVPEMMYHAAGGAAPIITTDPVPDLPVYSSDGLVADVFPMLVVGDESFTTVGFQTDGKTVKFKIIHKKPGKDIADRDDPYGEIGFMSIKWYYGFMVLRPERLAVIWTAATI